MKVVPTDWLTKQVFFFYQSFLHRHWKFTGQQGKGEDHLLFHSSTSTSSRTLRHLFATLHVRWLSRIFNRNTCIYQAAILDEIYDLIDLPFEWLIHDAMFVCLLDELILGFCYSELTLETNGFELASTITLVLQANRLTKCASHPKASSWSYSTKQVHKQGGLDDTPLFIVQLNTLKTYSALIWILFHHSHCLFQASCERNH